MAGIPGDVHMAAFVYIELVVCVSGNTHHDYAFTIRYLDRQGHIQPMIGDADDFALQVIIDLTRCL